MNFEQEQQALSKRRIPKVKKKQNQVVDGDQEEEMDSMLDDNDNCKQKI